MRFQDLTLGKKIACGFGIILILLAGMVVLSFTGIDGIVGNASQAIDGNRLDGLISQMMVDQLNWANGINTLLTDKETTRLPVEIDERKCSFGKWFYGEGRKEAERLVPTLKPYLQKIEGVHKKLHESARAIVTHFKQVDEGLPDLLAGGELDLFKWVFSIDEFFIKNKTELSVEIDPRSTPLGKWIYGEGARKVIEGNEKMAALIKELKSSQEKLYRSAAEIKESYKKIHPGLLLILKDCLEDVRGWTIKVSESILQGKNNLGVETDPSTSAIWKFMDSKEAAEYTKDFPLLKKTLSRCKIPLQNLYDSAVEIDAALKEGDKVKAEQLYTSRMLPYLKELSKHFTAAISYEMLSVMRNDEARKIFKTKTLPALHDTVAALRKVRAEAEDMLKGMREADRIYAQETLPALRASQSLLSAMRGEVKKHTMTDDAMLASAQTVKRYISMMGIAVIIVGILAAIFMTRGIIRIFRGISRKIDQGALRVASASNQILSASHSLAEGTGEQASSLEETSSALEEMSSMTRQNADHASQANGLMKDVNRIVEKANGSMKELTTAIEDISGASMETQKIVKAIDEIAFQTNLLALNAAVEAARAGEAGAGFAVVADEVRNLAMRAGEAAKNTAVLIDGTVNKVKNSAEIVGKTNEAFEEVTASSMKVGDLVQEIAAASSEQARGIEQINKAILEMDRLTQENAASAEECASASRVLNNEAEGMKGTVDELLGIIGLDRKDTDGREALETGITETDFPVQTGDSDSDLLEAPDHPEETQYPIKQ
ncbi:MAG: CZB domain-containing protein [Deltaproteobacteria bacterium]|nr:CZB domain-containing protein [Deltaproteobacteria bacterium]